MVLSIRAISSDNDAPLRELTELFKSEFSDVYPVEGVYELDFWKSHIGSRFCSVGIFNERNDLLAHVALANDNESKSQLNVSFAVAAGEFVTINKNELALVCQELKALILRYAERKAQPNIIFPVPASNKALQHLASFVCGEAEVCILPQYYPAQMSEDKSGKRVDLLVYKISTTDVEQCLEFHGPAQHEDMCRSLCSAVGFELSSNTNGKIATKILKKSRTAIEEAMSMRYHRRLGITQILLSPSLDPDLSKKIAAMDLSDPEAVYMFIDLEDSEASKICAELEGARYRFCGVAPGFWGKKATLVYSRMDAKTKSENYLNVENYLAPRAQKLAHYICDYGTGEAKVSKKAGRSVAGLGV